MNVKDLVPLPGGRIHVFVLLNWVVWVIFMADIQGYVQHYVVSVYKMSDVARERIVIITWLGHRLYCGVQVCGAALAFLAILPLFKLCFYCFQSCSPYCQLAALVEQLPSLSLG